MAWHGIGVNANVEEKKNKRTNKKRINILSALKIHENR